MNIEKVVTSQKVKTQMKIYIAMQSDNLEDHRESYFGLPYAHMRIHEESHKKCLVTLLSFEDHKDLCKDSYAVIQGANPYTNIFRVFIQ